MGWLIALAIILILAVFPLGLRAKYDAAGASVQVTAVFLRFSLYPAKKKVQKKEKKQKQKTENTDETEKNALSEFFPLIRVGLDFLGELRRKIRVERLYLRIVMSGEDPCDLAINCGRVNAAVGGLMPQIDRVFVIRKRDICVDCDFNAEKTTVEAQIDVNITLARLLILVVKYGWRALKTYRNMNQSNEGGAE